MGWHDLGALPAMPRRRVVPENPPGPIGPTGDLLADHRIP